MATTSTVKMMTTDMGIDAMRAIPRKFINDTRKEHAPIWSTYMRKVDTNEYYIEYFEFGGFGDIPLKDEGDYINVATPDTGDIARIQPEVRQLAFAITKEDRKYNRINKVERASKMLARAARRTVEKIAAYPLNVATSSVRVTTDGNPLVYNAHVLLNGSTYSNAGGGVDLSISTLETALVAFSTMIDNDGTYIDLRPKYLVVSPYDAPNARRILRAQNYWTPSAGLPSAADTGVPNATVQDANLILVVNPYLTDPDAWFLLADKGDHELVLVENEAFNDRSFVDPYTSDYVYSVEFANIAAAPNPVGIYGATGA